MKDGPEIMHELVNDIPVLMYVMNERLKLIETLDKAKPRHGNWLGLSIGQVMGVWLVHILSECNHFMSHVRDWANGLPHTLAMLMGQIVRETDLTDDRLGEVARMLSDDEIWKHVERATSQQMIRAYRLRPERVRLDTTTARVYSDQEAAVLFQRGYSKDHRPDLRQLKVMLAALDPLGVLVGADVVSGERADDGLYVPMIQRMQESLQPSGLLYIGDCKMSALATRAYASRSHNFYLMPLAHIGQVPHQLEGWINDAIHGRAKVVELTAEDGSVLGRGYEISRRMTEPTSGTRWNERVMIVHADAFAQAARRGLQQRLTQATIQLQALTPPPGRGKRQFADPDALHQAAQDIVTHHEVQGLLTWRIETVDQSKSVRAYANRPPRIEHRQRLTLQVTPNATAIAQLERRLGWRVYVTNAPRHSLSFNQAVLAYRDEWLIERNCARLKGRPLSLAPLWLKREDHAIGLTRLLTLAARVLALAEYDARLKLAKRNQTLSGLYPGQPTRATHLPTTERLLRAFDKVILTTLRLGDHVQRFLTSLCPLQHSILDLLGCPPDLYHRLIDDLEFA